MDTEEEESRHLPNVESSLRLEDVSVASQCERAGERAGDEIIASPVMTEEEGKANAVDGEGEGSAVDGVLEGLEKDELPEESGIAELAEEAGNLDEKKVVDDLHDQIEIPVEKEVADMVEERETADEAEVNDETQPPVVMEETEMTDKMGIMEARDVAAVLEKTGKENVEKTELLEEKPVDDVAQQTVVEKTDLLEEKPLDNVAEQSGILEEVGVGNMVERSDLLEEKPVDDIAQPTGILEVGMGNMVGRTDLLKEKPLDDVAKQSGILEVGMGDMVERTDLLEEKTVDDIAEQTGILEEVGMGDMVGITELLEEKPVDDVAEQTGILEEVGTGNMVGKTELLEEKPVDNVDEQTRIVEEAEVANITGETELLDHKEFNVVDQKQVLEETKVTKSEILEENLADNVYELSKNLEDTNDVRETSIHMDEVEEDKVVVEGTEKAEQTENAAAKIDTEMLDTAEDEDPEEVEEMEDAEDVEEEVEDASKASGGKRKRGKNSNSKVLARTPSRKKVEEDVCFICFDGGDLVLCDRRGCPKAYHSDCVGRDDAFFRAKGKWNCGWHLCSNSNCKKNAYYMCYTCTFSLCKGCIKDATLFCVRGNKGFCESCMKIVMLIERNEQAQVNFDDKSSWEYLFKDYWIDLKRRLSITSEELAQAKNPWKGSESHAAKQESPNELDGGGSGSDSSSGTVEATASKRRKTRSQTKLRARKGDSPSRVTTSGEGASMDENAEWASKELLEVVMHMRSGDKSVLSRMELSQLILDYIQKHKLRDRRNKSYVICDSRLKNLFGKPRVGHIEMLNLLDPHIFFTKEDSHTDDLQGSVVDAEANQLEPDWNSDAITKTGKDKKRRTRKKGDTRGLQSNLDDYAAIDIHNINLIYLKRNLVEELMEDAETFHDKVVGSFVRIRISGTGQKQDLYRLVQVVGTNKVAEPYRVGKRTTDFLLEILNLNKTEVISIDIISNQDFSEDECKRLRQSIKCGLINRLTVGDIQEKATAIQAVRVKDWLESEITRLSHLRDRASETGRRKELRECVEKLQILKSPEERQRRLEEIPEINVDPNMDPSYESEEDEGEDDKRQENYLRPRGSGFSRRVREPISPRKGGFSSSDSWSVGRNYSSINRELSRNLSNKGFLSKGDDSIGAGDKGNENLWNLGRERETQQPNSWNKPKTAFSSEIGVRNSQSVVIQEPSLKVVPDISPPPSAGVTNTVQINEAEKIWHYRDPSGKVQGPFSMVQLRKWSNTGYFPAELKIWRANEKQDDSILLTDALTGKFQKDPPVADNSFPKAQMASYGSSLGATLKQGIESLVGEKTRFDENHLAWSPQRTSGLSGQSAGESWKSQTESSSSMGRPAPSSVEIPKYSRDAWGSETNLPSPTPNQTPVGTAKGQAFESKWSPTPVQSSGSVSGPFRGGGATALQTPPIIAEGGSPAASIVHSHSLLSVESHRAQVNAQASINAGADMKNAGVSLQNLVQPANSHNPPIETHTWGSGSVLRQETVAASPIPATGTQAWGNASTQKLESHPSLAMPAQPAAYGHWNDLSQSGQNSVPLSSGNPGGGFPIPAQPTMLTSDSWRPTVPVQSNVQIPAPSNLPWGMTVADNQSPALRQVPGNQNTSWGPMQGNQNMGWGAPIPANTNVNWGASNQGSASVNPNPSWAASGQGQVPGNGNSGWTAPGNAMQGWAPPGQGPAVANANSRWVAPGQGAAPGSANPGYMAPSGNSGMWGSEQRDRGTQPQGGDSGNGGVKPWNRQSSFGGGGGSSRPPFNKGQRVCKYHESGHCKKGASCEYMHT